MAEEKPTTVKKFEPQMVDAVLGRVKDLQEVGGLSLPPDYSAANALRSAYLILQETKDTSGTPALQSCTTASIQNSLFKMVVDGLNPAKHQCSFIIRGNKLTLQREYAGSIALARRFGNMKDVYAGVIYDGDIFEFAVDTTTGMKKITKHEQRFDNLDDSKIKGAYAVVVLDDGGVNTEIMTMAQIKKSWEQGPTKGQSPAHKNFPGEMAKKTVINRACKLLIASSDDSILNEPGEDGKVPRQLTAETANTGPVIEMPEEEIQTPEVVEEPPVEEPPVAAPKRGKKNEDPEQTKAPF